ncbi:MAG: hypothetical protein HY608_02325 [Planctomycetes bacterium]|nr:hypothetical protein [Planctomycetota bacterium]
MTRAFALARVTLLEGLRARAWAVWVLYALILACLPALLSGIPPSAWGRSAVTTAYQAAALLTIASVTIAGARLVPRALESRVLFAVLTKPVRRAEYVAGGALGIASLAAVLAAGMGFVGGGGLSLSASVRSTAYSRQTGTVEARHETDGTVSWTCRAASPSGALRLVIPVRAQTWDGTALALRWEGGDPERTENVPRSVRAWEEPVPPEAWRDGAARLVVSVPGGNPREALGEAPAGRLLASDRTFLLPWCASLLVAWVVATLLGIAAFVASVFVSWRLAFLAALTFGICGANRDLLHQMPNVLTRQTLQTTFSRAPHSHAHDPAPEEAANWIDTGLSWAGRLLSALGGALPDLTRAQAAPTLARSLSIPPRALGSLALGAGAFGCLLLAAGVLGFARREFV